MYTILVTTNNEAIVSTPDQRIMQRSKLVDTLHILVAPTYNGISMSDCTVLMEYKLPVSQEARSEILSLSDELYKENLEYTLPGVSQSAIITRMAGRTPVPERESIASFAAHQATMVVFLSTGLLEELSGELIAGGYTAETPAAIVYKATWKEEEKYICTVGTLAQTAKEHNITKTALMIIGEAVTHSNYARSELYNPNFSTEYRKAKSEINPNEVKEK